MTSYISNPDALEALVGKSSPVIDLKVIDYLDEHAMAWLHSSTFAGVAFAGKGEPPVLTIAAGVAGFAVPTTPNELTIPSEALDEFNGVEEGAGVATIFFVPGLGETLRINGELLSASDAALHIRITECYLHCAKALIRSEFWLGNAPSPDDQTPLAACPFMLFATEHADGSVDLSPKGDPAGALFLTEGDDCVYIADRPGNRRMDGLKNILSNAMVSVLGLYPGQNLTVKFAGAARLQADETVCERLAVKGRTPKLLIEVYHKGIVCKNNQALSNAQLWPASSAPPTLRPAEILSAHIKLNKARGVSASLAKFIVTPKAVEKGLKQDYKKNLY